MRKIYNSQIDFHKNDMENFINSNEEDFKITVMDCTEALYGGESTIDKKYCDKHGIPFQNKSNKRRKISRRCST